MTYPFWQSVPSSGVSNTYQSPGISFLQSTYTRRALARVRSGNGSGKILCLGDSTVAGYGAQGNTNCGSPLSWPYLLAALLSNVPTVAGLGSAPALGTSSNDSRWTPGATGWTLAGGVGFGSNSGYQWLNGNAVSTLTYADPNVNADTFDVYYAKGATAGNFSIQATGGAVVNSAQAAPNGWGKLTCTAGALGTTNVLTITPANDGHSPIFFAVEPYNSTINAIRVGNAGVPGATSGGLRSVGAFLSPNGVIAYAPDLVIVSIGINDATAGTSAAGYLGNIATLVGQITALPADVIFVSPVPSESSVGANALSLEAQYTQGLISAGYPTLNLLNRWVSGDTANGLGMMYNASHPNGIGYSDISQFAKDLLINV